MKTKYTAAIGLGAMVLLGFLCLLRTPSAPRALHEAQFPNGDRLTMLWVPPSADDPPDARGHFGFRINEGTVHILAGCSHAGPRDRYTFSVRKYDLVPGTLEITELRRGLVWVIDPVKGYVMGNG
jgi:hypothetical protein